MTAILLARSMGSLRPVDDAGEAVIAGIGQGEIVKAEIKRPRNPQHHRLFWALASIVAANSEHWRSAEDVVTALKFATGHTEQFKMPSGQVYELPRSISFAAMNQDAFDAFYDRCIRVIVEKWLPGVSEDGLRQEVLEMIGT